LDLKDKPRVQNYFAGLWNIQGGDQAASRGTNVMSTIGNLGFWQRCTNYVHMMEDVLKALRVFDGKELGKGRAWLVMHNLWGHVYSLRYPPFSIRPHIVDILEKAFTHKWDMGFNDTHYATDILNLYIKGHATLNVDGSTLRTLYRVIR
jgi:hypothetical protein